MIEQNIRTPEKCETISEIREQIDKIDLDIIKALGIRFKFVKEIVKFKSDKKSIKAEDRYNAVLAQRRIWAQENGLHPDAIEKMYRDLIDHFINEEIRIFENKKDKS